MAVVSTLAQIFTLTDQGLGNPPDFPALQIKRAVHEACALYWTDLIQSDQNQVIKCTSSIPFVADTYIYSLAAITDMTMPDWVEMQVDNTDADWILVSVVNRDSLGMFRDRNELVCSIYSQLVNNVLVNTIEFSYIPWTLGSDFHNFRIWYDPAITVNVNDEAATGFPPEYNYLMATVAKIELIPILMRREVDLAAENKIDKDMLNAKIGTWNALLRTCEAKRIEWDKKWKFYSRGSRLNQGGRRKRMYMNAGYL